MEGGWAGDTCEEAHDARGLSLPSRGDNDLVPTAYSSGWVWEQWATVGVVEGMATLAPHAQISECDVRVHWLGSIDRGVSSVSYKAGKLHE